MLLKNVLNNEDLFIVLINKSLVRKGWLWKMILVDVVLSMVFYFDEKFKMDVGVGLIVLNVKCWMLWLNVVVIGVFLFGGLYFVVIVGFDNVIVSVFVFMFFIVGVIGVVVVWKDFVVL